MHSKKQDISFPEQDSMRITKQIVDGEQARNYCSSDINTVMSQIATNSRTHQQNILTTVITRK